jgi:hypothetical protein
MNGAGHAYKHGKKEASRSDTTQKSKALKTQELSYPLIKHAQPSEAKRCN